MSKTTQDKNPKDKGSGHVGINPFPGLRPFGIEESHLFFGREGQSEEVLRNLAQNRFVAVIGASGSGKSSLMYCGLVPILHGGFITEAGSDWQMITTRPGNDPIGNLATSIARAGAQNKQDSSEKDIQITGAVLRRSSKGLIEALKQQVYNGSSNILLMVDQFEELFRYKKSRRDAVTFNESEAFVKLLVEVVRQSEVPVYTILTMRSDFIGECSQFQELTSLINDSNYLIPQMTRDDFKDAVTGPVAVGGATIDPNLVQQLLNDVGDNPDQLPILQHALMRTWEYWVLQKDLERPISISDYEAVGTMEKALSEHANEAFEELSPKEKGVCESMFKTLTEKGGDNIGIRQPTRLEVVAEIARAENEDVARVVEVFRKSGRSFLTPASPIPLKEGSVIDISHESIMRIWDRLKIWVEEEAQAVQMYSRLSEASALFQAGKTGLWRPPDLQLALNWRKKQQPSLTWATRYNPAFERAIVFLETSEKEYIADEQNKIRLQKRALKRTRTFAMVLGTAAIISMGMMLYAFVLRDQAVKSQAEALYQAAVADTAKLEAQFQADIAAAQRDTAQIQTEIAEYQAAVADTAKTEAQTQATIAAREAQRAQDSAAAAQRQRNIAVEQQQEANRQRTLAEQASDEAYSARMLSISQSMAVKSLQVDNDTSLKALLAYQSYLFNERYEGPEHNADVYAGLYDALKFLRGDDYNVYTGHTDAVRSLVFAPDKSTFYSAGGDGQVLKWDIEGKTSQVLIQNQLVNRVLDISEDGKWLACGTDGEGIQLFQTARSGEPRLLNRNDSRIRAVDFLPGNERMFSGGMEGIITQWDLNTGRNETFAETGSPVDVLVISNDGSRLAAGTRDGKIIVWNINSGEQEFILNEDEGNSVYALDFSPDGKLLVSGDLQGNVIVWDFEQRTELNNLRGHRARITQLKFSPDGKFMATSSNDGSARIWETADLNNQPIVLTANSGYIFSVAFSPDSKSVITGSTDESRLVLSPTGSTDMVEGICGRLDRNFTTAEWNAYIGTDIPYEDTCGEAPTIGIKRSDEQ
jgi:WD40 repeat protein